MDGECVLSLNLLAGVIVESRGFEVVLVLALVVASLLGTGGGLDTGLFDKANVT